MEDQRSQMTRDIPLRRLATPREIANVVEFLMSEELTYVNGHNMILDGGRFMRHDKGVF